MAQYYNPTQTQVQRAPQVDVTGMNRSITGIQSALQNRQRDILTRDRMQQQDAIARDKMLVQQNQFDITNTMARDEMEADALWREAESKRQAENARLTAANRANRLNILENEHNEQVKQNQYIRDINEGEGIGAGFSFNATRPGEDKVEMEDIPKDAFVGGTDVDKQKAYMEYLSKNDPDYKKSVIQKYGEDAWNLVKTTPTRLPSMLASTIFGDSSTAAKEREILTDLGQLKKPGLKSKNQFFKDYDAKLKTEYDATPPKQEKVVTPTTERVSKRNLLEQVDNQIKMFSKQYEAEYDKKPSRGLLTGIRKEAVNSARNILNTRKMKDKLKYEAIMDQMDKAQEHAYKKELEKLKHTPTIFDKARAAETVMKTKILEKELYDE